MQLWTNLKRWFFEEYQLSDRFGCTLWAASWVAMIVVSELIINVFAVWLLTIWCGSLLVIGFSCDAIKALGSSAASQKVSRIGFWLLLLAVFGGFVIIALLSWLG